MRGHEITWSALDEAAQGTAHSFKTLGEQMGKEAITYVRPSNKQKQKRRAAEKRAKASRRANR